MGSSEARKLGCEPTHLGLSARHRQATFLAICRPGRVACGPGRRDWTTACFGCFRQGRRSRSGRLAGRQGLCDGPDQLERRSGSLQPRTPRILHRCTVKGCGRPGHSLAASTRVMRLGSEDPVAAWTSCDRLRDGAYRPRAQKACVTTTAADYVWPTVGRACLTRGPWCPTDRRVGVSRRPRLRPQRSASRVAYTRRLPVPRDCLPTRQVVGCCT